MTEGAARGNGRSDAVSATAAMIAVPLAFAAARFFDYLRGGVFSFRDTAFFFAPWRDVYVKAVRAGAFPFWNEWMSCGRAFAADPNAAVFSPLTPAVLVVGFTGAGLVAVAAVLLCAVLGFRLLRLSRLAASAAAVVLLFSGVFQTVPLLATTIASAAPLPIALALALRLDPADSRRFRRDILFIALALGLSVLGGEPAVTAMGAAGALFLTGLGAAPGTLGRRLAATTAALLFAGALAAVQILPTAGEVLRSARSELRPETGTLFWSVRPARVLTLLEPRLTGDPGAESELDFWGAGTFDAGNPYFYDVAIGLVPLLVALAAAAERRGRLVLSLAALGALLATGRFLPGFTLVAPLFSVFRYAEKWWLLSTIGLVFAVAIGLDLLGGSGGEDGSRRARTILRRAAFAAAGVLAAGALAAAGAPRLLRAFLWSAHLGAGATPAERVGADLLPLLLAGAGTALVVAILPVLVERRRVSTAVAASVLALLFLFDAARRVAGACPAGAPDTYRRTTPALDLVKAAIGEGRFYDDRADDPATGVRRAAEAGGFDPLRPTTGVLHGVRYAGENDVDRMTPREAFAFTASLARLSWGEAKARELRKAAVTVVRTAAPPPDPAGTHEVGRFGSDRIVALEGTRPEFSFDSGGVVKMLDRSPNEVRLEATVEEAVARMAIARTFDPSWHARVDGVETPLVRADGFLTALDVPRGRHRVELRYRNPLFTLGALVSIASFAVLAGLLFAAKAR